jgi:hypothetical protein
VLLPEVALSSGDLLPPLWLLPGRLRRRVLGGLLFGRLVLRRLLLYGFVLWWRLLLRGLVLRRRRMLRGFVLRRLVLLPRRRRLLLRDGLRRVLLVRVEERSPGMLRSVRLLRQLDWPSGRALRPPAWRDDAPRPRRILRPIGTAPAVRPGHGPAVEPACRGAGPDGVYPLDQRRHAEPLKTRSCRRWRVANRQRRAGPASLIRATVRVHLRA